MYADIVDLQECFVENEFSVDPSIPIMPTCSDGLTTKDESGETTFKVMTSGFAKVGYTAHNEIVN